MLLSCIFANIMDLFLQFFGISGKINSILQINSPDCAACSGRSEGIFREQ